MRVVQPQKVQRTAKFDAWLDTLTDELGRQAIVSRIVRIEAGLFGDAESVGGGVSEIKVDVGPGYRAYFHRQGLTVTLLLCGGDKSTQASDIQEAKAMVAALKGQVKATPKKTRKR